MKKIFWRVFIYFGVVLLVFSIMLGLMFTRFNRTNIVGAYKQQLGDLASGVAKRTSQAAKNGNVDSFVDYLKAIEDFCNLQSIDIWIVSNPQNDSALEEDYTNMNLEAVDLPVETQNILQSAYDGKKTSYSDYDSIYQQTMLHLAVPIRDNDGDVIGVVVATGPMEMQENTIVQYQKYMFICVISGLLLTLFLALFFSQQLIHPIIRLKEMALVLAAGKYEQKTGIHRRDELGQLADSMDILSERLVEAQEYQKQTEQHRRDFFSNVSHELRTPIAVAKGYADTLADGYVDDEQKKMEYLKRIQRECDGMERLVSDLLIMSRMQNPDYQLDIEVINVIAVAQDAMRSMRILMKEKNLTGEVTYEDECSLIDGDYDRVRQLFVILLQNAVKYSDENTQIHVHIARTDGQILVDVKDFGSVIPRTEWENVFEKFYRASNHGANEGSGLGLVVAKSITLRHGGTIAVSSTKEDGTIFKINFPETSQKIT